MLNRQRVETVESDKIWCQEHICGGCPGTLWGTKSICRIHQISVGQVNECKEWSRSARSRSKSASIVKEGVNTYKPSEEMTSALWAEKMEDELKDYPWMVREVARLREELQEIDAGLTAKYGIEAGMPTAKGAANNMVQREVQKREKRWQRLVHLENRVRTIELAVDRVEGDRSRTILACMMEGRRIKDIADHIGISRQRLHLVKRDLMTLMAGWIYGGGMEDKNSVDAG